MRKIGEIVVIGVQLQNGLNGHFLEGHNLCEHFVDSCAADNCEMAEIIVVTLEKQRNLGRVFC